MIDSSEILAAYPVPPHIMAAASACRYDLLHGPSYSLIPTAGIEAFTVDHYASFAADLDAESGAVTETYCGPVGDALRDFIADLPGAVYVDESGYVIGEREPEGEYLGPDYEPCSAYDDGAEYHDPEPYYKVTQRDVVAALFGAVIAREFN